jgi:hypothetical protein
MFMEPTGTRSPTHDLDHRPTRTGAVSNGHTATGGPAPTANAVFDAVADPGSRVHGAAAAGAESRSREPRSAGRSNGPPNTVVAHRQETE